MSRYIPLDVSGLSEKAQKVKDEIERNIVGQKDGINALIDIVEKFNANIMDNSRPIGSALFLGPTGSGKTKLVEEFCNALYNDENRCVKIDCGEFQHTHEIAKLIGSPPGYLGHKETPARLKQSTLDGLHTTDFPFSIILFDEIEKASDALWHLLLSILDKATITLGDNTSTNFSKSIILMTSNAGSVKMTKAVDGGMGFQFIPTESYVDDDEIARIGIDAAKKKFTPEFINRLDRMVAFHTLSKEQIAEVANKEIDRLQRTILIKSNPIIFFRCTPACKQQLIDEGFDPKYNGRHIRRVVERQLGLPLAKIISQRLVVPSTQNYVMCDFKEGKYEFGLVEG